MRLKKPRFERLTRKHRAADIPWVDSMNAHQPSQAQEDGANSGQSPGASQATVAPFSLNQQTASRTRTQGSILIHQKSPLLLATPPQVTRALAYSHPFILPLNHLVGLLSWTTDDPWESFLLLAAFWFIILYGDRVLRWAGPPALVVGLIAGMYARRYSPLSSTVWSGEKAKRKRADSEQQRKSLDEILDILQAFSGRCDVLLDPFLHLTEFLSTQSSATSATTRPALTSLLIRILAFTPIWIGLTLPPLRLINTQRLVLAIGTLGLSWHSRPARVSRTILWRSHTVRRVSSFLTGLQFSPPSPTSSDPPPLPQRKYGVAANTRTNKESGPGVRFTFIVYENQRRWIGLGWTASLFTYERQAWTDEHLNPCDDPENLTLPDTESEHTRWRWAPDSEWHVEGAQTSKEKSAKRIGGGGGGDESGWTYYDNKWQDGRKMDGWGRYTRRRKWMRDADLVETGREDGADPERASAENDGVDSSGTDLGARKKGWFGRRQSHKNKSVDKTDVASGSTSASTADTARSRDGPDGDLHTPARYSEWDRSIGDGIAEGLS